jgi:uncharacterized protein YraI
MRFVRWACIGFIGKIRKSGERIMPVYARWIKVILALGCLAAVLALAPLVLAQGSGPVVVINAPALNQRTGPGPEYAIQGVLAGGEVVPVIGRTADRTWWQVHTRFGNGWVSNEFVFTRNSFRDVPIVTEYGVLQAPLAIVSGRSLNAYAVPNPGGQVLGLAITGDQFPIVARSYFSGAETWYWLVETTDGQAWLPGSEGLALFGYTDRVPVLSREDAFALPRTGPAGSGRISPPPLPPVPDAPTAPEAAATIEALSEPAEPAASESGAEPSAASTPAAAPAVVERYSFVLAGDCAPLALVNYLVQRGPAAATGLSCSNSVQAVNAVQSGLADLGIAVDAGCGDAVTVPVATIFNASGAHTLNFCISASANTPTRAFVDWVRGGEGAAAIRAYQGLPGSSAPESAEPLG